MPLGQGKYDDLCTKAREESEADAAIVIILNGNKGSGFSCQSPSLAAVHHLPDLLESVAKEIRASLEGGNV